MLHGCSGGPRRSSRPATVQQTYICIPPSPALATSHQGPRGGDSFKYFMHYSDLKAAAGPERAACSLLSRHETLCIAKINYCHVPFNKQIQNTRTRIHQSTAATTQPEALLSK